MSRLALSDAINREFQRQQLNLSMIASESIPWPSVWAAYSNNWLCTKYAEGYPGTRYYGGCENADGVESIALKAAKELFGAAFANVQPLSGSNANLAALLALAKPGDTILGMSLKSGGHLTHGASVSLTGKWFNSVSYDIEPDGKIDYDKIQNLALAHQPKIIFAGVSAYPRQLKIEKFRTIADSVGAYLIADMAHVSGLVAGKAYPNPTPYADVVTSTTHKTLRGPRGGIILSRDIAIGKKIDRAVFPGLQGGPFMHSIAAKAAAFLENYSEYAQKLINNARAIGDGLRSTGTILVADYDQLATDTHILLLDLSGICTGQEAQNLLAEANIICNKNCIPHDLCDARNPSGIRLGSTVATNRGITEADGREFGKLIGEALIGKSNVKLKRFVKEWCKSHPILPANEPGY